MNEKILPTIERSRNKIYLENRGFVLLLILRRFKIKSESSDDPSEPLESALDDMW